jgi:endonuclease I/subtilisin-like proprotein convertase family protein/chitodextrinase
MNKYGYKKTSWLTTSLTMIGLNLAALSASAAIPTGYYDTVDLNNAASLRTTLHEIIDDHQRFPYTSTSTDTWDILETADENPDDGNSIIDIYKNESYVKQGGGNSFYNREHTWPKSYGFPDDGTTNSPYTDTHHLFLSDSGYNSSRSNLPYANCESGCSENATVFNNGRGGSGGGDSNWRTGSFSQGSWETWDERKGDVARALMYMAIRYEGGVHGVTGFNEPDLILTNDRNLIDTSSTGSNGSVAYMGLLSTLIEWHKADPVDDFERRHTEGVYTFQGNRNPFIDHPEYVECVFESLCNGEPDVEAPLTPSNLLGADGSGLASLSWDANTEVDLIGYNVYRSQMSGGTYTKLNTSVVSTNSYVDENVTPFTTYYYVVVAVDSSLNASPFSNEAFATPGEVVSSNFTAWVNEFHYDNASTDVDELIEVAGTAGTDLSSWSLVLYNGNGGAAYNTVNLSGVISDQQSGYGTLSFAISGIQNGAPDGFALVDNTGAVVQFLSYEGSFTAVGGAADGLVSVDVGVAETSTTLAGNSLQLVGSGTNYSDFSWQAPSVSNSGAINTGQSFTSGNLPPVASFTFSCNLLDCNFDANGSSDVEGSIASYSWMFGDGGSNSGVTTSNSFLSLGAYNVTLEVADSDGATATQTQVVDVTDVVAPPASNDAWVNEFHYDNASTDTGEFIEIAGSVGTDLSEWTLVLYNGNGGSSYKTVSLSGIITNETNGFGAITFDISGIQNGGPDGFALIDNAGAVVQFLSYEGSFTAVGGAADGMLSIDVGVSETSSTLVGDSLQLIGNGTSYSEFTWQSVSASSPALININQTFPLPNQAPTATFTSSCDGLMCHFDASESADIDGTIVAYDWDFGDANSASGSDASNAYLSAGSYAVTLTVTDDNDASSSFVSNIEVVEAEESFFENITVMPIPDRRRIVSKIDVERSGLAGTVEVAVNISHSYRGDLVIKLKAPDGSVYKLKRKDRTDGNADVIETYSVDVTGNATGQWKLVVKDKFKKDTGQLNNWSIQFP